MAVRPAAGSHAPRSRARPAPSALRPLLLLESNQPLEGLAASDDAALRELDQLLNMLQAKGKRSQDLADKVRARAARARGPSLQARGDPRRWIAWGGLGVFEGRGW